MFEQTYMYGFNIFFLHKFVYVCSKFRPHTFISLNSAKNINSKFSNFPAYD